MASTNFAKALSARQIETANQTIKGTVIVSRFCNCLNLPQDIDPTTPLDDLLHGSLVKWDLGLMLNAYRPFLNDGLKLRKRDVMNTSTVGQLGDLVFKWYRDNGWRVV